MRRCMLLLVWTLFALYPNPLMLGMSAQRAWSPPLDPQAVASLAQRLPDDPHAIESAVVGGVVRYAVPWQTYNVPWYFPTVSEVLDRGEGDCEAQALVLASVLRAKGIPAKLVGSFDHLWVDYPGKHANASENKAVAIVAQQDDGGYHFNLPQLVDWQKSWAIERSYFWDTMPEWRRYLLLLGWLVIALWGIRWQPRLVWRTNAKQLLP